MIHLMMLIRYCIVSFRTSVSPKLSDLVHLYYTSFVSNCQENIITKKHKNSAPVSGCGQTVDKKHSHRSKRRGVNAFFKQEQTFAPKNVWRQVSEFFKCSDRTFIPPGIGGFTHRRSAIMAIRPFGFAAAEGVLTLRHGWSTKEAPHRLGGGVLLCATHTIRIFFAK